MNRLQERFAEVLLEKIAEDRYPSVTQMNLFESVATPELLIQYVMVLLQRIEDDARPSISLENRVQRLVMSFG